MARIVLLDAGVIGLLVSSPRKPAVAEGKAWLAGLLGRADVTIPDVAAFEVRREPIRLGASAKLDRLADLRDGLTRSEVTVDAWIKAAEFWATVRKAGRPTARPAGPPPAPRPSTPTRSSRGWPPASGCPGMRW